MRKGLAHIGYIFLALGLSVSASAEERADEVPAFGFKFQKNDPILTPKLSSTLELSDSNPLEKSNSLNSRTKNSYDAIFYYPMHRQQGVSFDLGVNLRVQEEQHTDAELSYGGDRDWLNIDPSETRTMIHAAAVFELPFDGLKAGVSGTYDPGLHNSEYDYRAKLSYQWRSGIGLEGGWQHQQKSLEQQSLDENTDVQTLFLDMNYRF